MSVALPCAVAFTFLAYTLTDVLGGAAYLPDGAIATQLIMRDMPIGWIDGLTQYVLIALNLQKRITSAFVWAVGFNIISNLILIPPYGYRAAAVTTILSELALLIPFALLLRSEIGAINWLSMVGKPVLAAAVMFGVLALGWGIQPALALVVASAAYVSAWLLLRVFDAAEWATLAPLVPGKLRRFVPMT